MGYPSISLSQRSLRCKLIHVSEMSEQEDMIHHSILIKFYLITDRGIVFQ